MKELSRKRDPYTGKDAVLAMLCLVTSWAAVGALFLGISALISWWP